MDLWSQSGDLVMSAGGEIVLCAACPCYIDPEVECERKVKEAIRERQVAVGLTPWTYEEALPKTRAQCITAANALALFFIQNTAWGEGASGGVTFWSSSYANSATNWCELYTLVCALRVTGLATSWSSMTGQQGLVRGYFTPLTARRYVGSSPQGQGATREAKIELARAAWRTILTTGTPYMSTSLDTQYAIADAQSCILRLVSPRCAINRTMRIFLECRGGGSGKEYHTHGWTSMAEYQYMLAFTSPTGLWDASWNDPAGKLWSMYVTPEWPPYPVAFPEDWPETMPGTTHMFESRFSNTVVMLIDWEFAHHL